MELDARMAALRERFRLRAGADGERIAGALGVISKPFDPMKLADAVLGYLPG